MTEQTNNLAFPGDPAAGSTAVSCRLLSVFAGVVSAARTANWHEHPFWQLEVVSSGQIEAASDTGAWCLRGGASLLIPPGARHRFDYRKIGAEWLTLKFDASVPGTPRTAAPLASDPVQKSFREALLALGREPELDAPGVRLAIEGVLSAVLAYRYVLEDGSSRSADPLVARVCAYVHRSRRRRLTVRDVACEIGYSASHVSMLFSRATGETLKHYIDRERAELARHLVVYSDMNISEVAACLDFPDLFGFSRFFKRQMGVSPRAFRRRARSRAHRRRRPGTAHLSSVRRPGRRA